MRRIIEESNPFLQTLPNDTGLCYVTSFGQQDGSMTVKAEEPALPSLGNPRTATTCRTAHRGGLLEDGLHEQQINHPS